MDTERRVLHLMGLLVLREKFWKAIEPEDDPLGVATGSKNLRCSTASPDQNSNRHLHRGWREEVVKDMAQLRQCDSKELEEVIFARLKKGPPGYRRILREGLQRFLYQQADNAVTIAIRKSLDKYDSGPGKLLADRENTRLALVQVEAWCQDQGLVGPKPDSYIEAHAERVQILALIANASGDLAGREYVMNEVTKAFRELLDPGVLNNWVLSLGPALKVILGWTDLLKGNPFREKIENLLKLIDRARDQIDPARVNVELNEWEMEDTPAEQRQKAAEILRSMINKEEEEDYASWGAQLDANQQVADQIRRSKENGKFNGGPATVDLSNLNLRTLPGAIGVLKHTRTLLLNGSPLESLPESFVLLTDLEEVNLAGNNFTSTPPALEALTKLKVIRSAGGRAELPSTRWLEGLLQQRTQEPFRLELQNYNRQSIRDLFMQSAERLVREAEPLELRLDLRNLIAPPPYQEVEGLRQRLDEGIQEAQMQIQQPMPRQGLLAGIINRVKALRRPS